MKKYYVKPSVEVINVETSNMMATSIGIHGGSVDTSTPGVQNSRENLFDIEWD